MKSTSNNLQTVFELLRDHDLYANPDKNAFFQSKIEYLGHIVSSQGIRPDPKKINTIKNWPKPQTIHEVRSFLVSRVFIESPLRIFHTLHSPSPSSHVSAQLFTGVRVSNDHSIFSKTYSHMHLSYNYLTLHNLIK